MKRLLHGLATGVVGLMLAVPLGASARTYDEGGFRWEYNVWENEDTGAWEASIIDVWQIDEKGDWKAWDATTLTVPATLPADGTNEYARLEKEYKEDGSFLSNKFVTVYGPEVKSVAATVTSLDAWQGGNEKLTSVTIPETVKEVWGFDDCKNLTTVTMGAETEFYHESFANTPWLKSQGEFIVRDGVLIAYQGTATSVVVPDGITEIGDGAFSTYYNEDMTNLTSVTLPVGLEEIGSDAFCDCEKLASINLPDSVTRIDSYAFQGCSSLANVLLPAKLKYLGVGAFSHCDALTGIVIPASVKRLYRHAFYCCLGLTSVTLPAGLEEIGSEAFFGASLTTVDIPASVTYIDDSAFEYCAKLTTITGCAGLEDVGWSVFDNTAFYDNITDGIVQVGPIVICGKGTLPATLTIPEGVTRICSKAFYGDGNVKTVNLPSTLKEIGSNAFYYSAVESVTGGDGVTEVGSYAFLGSPYASTFVSDRGNKDKPFGLVRLGGVAFGYTGVCPAEVVIPDDVTLIERSLFDKDDDDSVSNITSVVVGSGVKIVRSLAFYRADNLKTVTISGALESLGYGVFEECTSLTDVTITGTRLELADDVFGGCVNLANVTINLVEPEEDDEDDEETGADLRFESATFSSCDKLASVKVTRPGFQLTGWRAWGALDEEIVFADELDSLRLWWVRREGANAYYLSDDFQAVWKRVLRNAANDAPFNNAVANTYIGWLTDADGNLVGTATVKIQKKGRDGLSKAVVYVTLIGAKKVTLKGTFDANGVGQGALAGLVLTANGLSGSLAVNGTAYTIDGARDVAKASKDPEQAFLKTLNKKAWTLVLAPKGENPPAFANGFAGLSVTMGTKGKAKLAGTLPDGTKLNINAQTVVGDFSCCIPIIYSKPKSSFGFLVWIDRTGNALDVTAISEWKGKVVGSGAFATQMELVSFESLKGIAESTTFSMDAADLPATLTGVQTDYLPINEPITVSARKWALAKPATIKFKRGVFDQVAYDKGLTSGKSNDSSLKLKYSSKTGLFSGSFTIFTLQGTSLKKVTAIVNGVVCDCVGYGSATIRKHGTIPVWIGDIEEDED